MDEGRDGLYPAGPADYAVPPGDTLAELMTSEEPGARAALAGRMGMSGQELELLLAGRTPVDDAMAARLEQETGVAARIWLRLEADYRGAALARTGRGEVDPHGRA